MKQPIEHFQMQTAFPSSSPRLFSVCLEGMQPFLTALKVLAGIHFFLSQPGADCSKLLKNWKQGKDFLVLHEKRATDHLLKDLFLSSISLSSVSVAKSLCEPSMIHFTHLCYLKNLFDIFQRLLIYYYIFLLYKEFKSFPSYIKKELGQCSFFCKMKICRESRGVLIMLDIRNVFHKRKQKRKSTCMPVRQRFYM